MTISSQAMAASTPWPRMERGSQATVFTSAISRLVRRRASERTGSNSLPAPAPSALLAGAMRSTRMGRRPSPRLAGFGDQPVARAGERELQRRVGAAGERQVDAHQRGEACGAGRFGGGCQLGGPGLVDG